MKNLKGINKCFKQKKTLKSWLFLFLLSTTATFTANAQSETGIGIKAGLNYNSNGDYMESITYNAQKPDRNVGYHFGLFGKIGDQIYFRPELVYTSTKSDYNDADFSMQKLDMPLLVGLKVLGPINVFAGPSFQYILDTEFNGISITDIEKDFTACLNFGVALNFNKIGVDLRYERGFNSNEAKFLNNNGIDISRLNTRPSQLILSVALVL